MTYKNYDEQSKSARVRCTETRQVLDALGVGQNAIKDLAVNFDSVEVNPASFISFNARELIAVGTAVSSISLASYALHAEATQNGLVRADDTDYPIGSTARLFTVSGGAITAAKMYLKTAANTWTVIGSVT